MDDNSKRRIGDGESTIKDNKRLKTEPKDGLLDDELNALLNQQVGSSGTSNSNNNQHPHPQGANRYANGNLDFNNLPDDLLDSIDQSVSTPDVMNFSRSSTPMNGTDARSISAPLDDVKRTMSSSTLSREPSTIPSYGQPLPQPSQLPPSSQLPQPAATKTKDLYSNDPSKLNDAIAAAGVDIHHEEEYLLQQRNRNTGYNASGYQNPVARAPINFLNPYNVSAFMQKVARENGVMQNFLSDPELLELMSVSCEKWMSDIITKTIIMSRHRQRGIPNVNKKPSAIQRSELSKELRNLAHKQKELEEQRVNRRMILGLEKSDDHKKDDGKGGADESLHRAANATAAMMTMNPSRKKYSWMTAGSGGPNGGATGGGNGGSAGDKDGGLKKSHIMTARGENGLRYREIRTGQAVTMKDLLSAIEDERMGVKQALLKGYSKLKD